MITATRGDFTVKPVSYSSWYDVEFRSDAGVAVAELQRTCPDEYGVWGVKVVEGDRACGLGSALMAGIVAIADLEHRDLFLKCIPAESGEWIVSFYERFGFTVTLTSTTYDDVPILTMEREAR